MSYVVLARKWRPQSFEDLVGQEHVSTTIANAITQNRVAHAFLFTGVRGVGKTTSARILAKTLNCEKGPTPKPCQVCPACVEITNGADVDVQEIDGASYTGVDDVRKLQESMPYRPQRDRFKIYIVDEVHMLSVNAWNAFLKTLEEPPPHVKFIFATTEVHKVPVTILSRCQRYDFKLIPAQTIAARLKWVLGQENIGADDAAIATIAREAAGSMRDAMSLLDQVIAWIGVAGDRLTAEGVARVLGVADRQVLHRLAGALVDGDPGACVKIVGELAGEGYDIPHVAKNILAQLRDLAVAKVCDEPEKLLDLAAEEIADVKALAARAQPDDLVRLHQGFSKAFDDIVRGGQPRASLEMALIRLARRPPLVPIEDLLLRLADLERRIGGGAPSGGGGGSSGGGGGFSRPGGRPGGGSPGWSPRGASAAPHETAPAPSAAAAHPAEPQSNSDVPKGLADAPKGLADAPKGLADAPQSLAEGPKGLSEEPKGLSEAPKGLSGDTKHPSDDAKGLSGDTKHPSDDAKGPSEEHKAPLAASQSVAAASQSNTVQPQSTAVQPQSTAVQSQSTAAPHSGPVSGTGRPQVPASQTANAARFQPPMRFEAPPPRANADAPPSSRSAPDPASARSSFEPPQRPNFEAPARPNFEQPPPARPNFEAPQRPNFEGPARADNGPSSAQKFGPPPVGRHGSNPPPPPSEGTPSGRAPVQSKMEKPAEKMPTPPSHPASEADIKTWRKLVEDVRKRRPALASVLAHAQIFEMGPERVLLAYDQTSFLYGQATENSAKDLLTNVVRAHFGEKAEVVFEIAVGRTGTTIADLDTLERRAKEEAARKHVAEHPLVLAAIKVLGAELIDVRLVEGPPPPETPRSAAH